MSAADHERSRRRAFAVAGVAGALCVAALIGLVLVVTRGGEPVRATEQVLHPCLQRLDLPV